MTDMNQTTNDDNAKPEATANAQAQASEMNTQQTECGKERCKSFHAFWHQHNQRCGYGKPRRKVIIGALLIGLFGFMLGKGVAHHHEHWQQQVYQPSVNMAYEGRGQNLPLSLVLDGIEATPAQRAKAVELLH